MIQPARLISSESRRLLHPPPPAPIQSVCFRHQEKKRIAGAAVAAAAATKYSVASICSGGRQREDGPSSQLAGNLARLLRLTSIGIDLTLERRERRFILLRSPRKRAEEERRGDGASGRDCRVPPGGHPPTPCSKNLEPRCSTSPLLTLPPRMLGGCQSPPQLHVVAVYSGEPRPAGSWLARASAGGGAFPCGGESGAFWSSEAFSRRCLWLAGLEGGGGNLRRPLQLEIIERFIDESGSSPHITARSPRPAPEWLNSEKRSYSKYRVKRLCQMGGRATFPNLVPPGCAGPQLP